MMKIFDAIVVHKNSPFFIDVVIIAKKGGQYSKKLHQQSGAVLC
jgi:hypothetical protein